MTSTRCGSPNGNDLGMCGRIRRRRDFIVSLADNFTAKSNDGAKWQAAAFHACPR
jgi:hypothetical protein